MTPKSPTARRMLLATVPNHHNTMSNTLTMTIHHPHNQTILQTMNNNFYRVVFTP